MDNYKYILEPYKGLQSRFICPNCAHRDKTFVRYIDTESGNYIHPSVGRCNRESSCGYHLSPKQYFSQNNSSNENYEFVAKRDFKISSNNQVQISSIPYSFVLESLRGYNENNFIKYLVSLFGIQTAEELISKYLIATSKQWNGATIFWQIDINQSVRTGKIMLYDSISGKRVKKPFNHISWVHKHLKIEGFNLTQCLFGEHLLADNNKPVAIVESEKTAIISSVYFPKLIWLASGSLNNLNIGKCNVLKGRTVFLFPDLNGYERWTDKAKELHSIFHVEVSDFLERYASHEEKERGLDLADYLINFKFQDFEEKGSCWIMDESELTNAIKMQVSKLNLNYWVLDMKFDARITEYNLDVLVSDLLLNFSIKTNKELYYKIFTQLNQTQNNNIN